MKIGIDGNEANVRNRVGVNQYAYQILVYLEKLPEAKKHEFIIYLKDKPLDDLPGEREGWKYEVLSGGPLWVLTRLMPHLWRNRHLDIFFSPTHYAPFLIQTPFVVSIMDLGYLDSREQFRKYDFIQLKYWGMLSMRFAKKIIAISEATKKDIISHYPWAKDKVEVTLLGYDSDKFKIQNSKFKIEGVKRKYGIKGEYILFLSTLKPSKNVEGLLEAFKILVGWPLAVDYNLVIAGKKGWLYESIFAKVKKLGLEKKVIFTDFIPEEDKAPLVTGAKIFVSPSFWEGFGIHVLEAMAVGTPVVVSNIGSLPEVVGNAGILVNPNNSQDIADGIELAIKDYKNLSSKSTGQAKKFDWEKTAKETLALLTSVSTGQLKVP